MKIEILEVLAEFWDTYLQKVLDTAAEQIIFFEVVRLSSEVMQSIYDNLSGLPEDVNEVKQLLGLDGTYTTIVSKLQKINFEAQLNFEPTFTSLGHGDLMTIQSFKEQCDCLCYTDDDGFGYYVRDNMESNIVAYPTEIKAGMIDPRFTHVIWYNR